MDAIWWFAILAFIAFAIFMVFYFKDYLPINNPVRKFIRLLQTKATSAFQSQTPIAISQPSIDTSTFVQQLADALANTLSQKTAITDTLAQPERKTVALIERPGVPVGDSDATATSIVPKHQPPHGHSAHEMFLDDYSKVGFKRRSRMLHVHVNQSNYDVTTGKLTVPVNQKNVESFELFYAAIPKSEYVISSDNKTFEIAHIDAVNPDYSGTVTIVEGIYTASALATAVASADAV